MTERHAAHAPTLRERYHNSSIVNLQSSIPDSPVLRLIYPGMLEIESFQMLQVTS